MLNYVRFDTTASVVAYFSGHRYSRLLPTIQVFPGRIHDVQKIVAVVASKNCAHQNWSRAPTLVPFRQSSWIRRCFTTLYPWPCPSQLSIDTMHTMTSDRGVRRPRPQSQPKRRRLSLASRKTKNKSGVSSTGGGPSGKNIFNLSTHEALRRSAHTDTLTTFFPLLILFMPPLLLPSHSGQPGLRGPGGLSKPPSSRRYSQVLHESELIEDSVGQCGQVVVT